MPAQVPVKVALVTVEPAVELMAQDCTVVTMVPVVKVAAQVPATPVDVMVELMVEVMVEVMLEVMVASAQVRAPVLAQVPAQVPSPRLQLICNVWGEARGYTWMRDTLLHMENLHKCGNGPCSHCAAPTQRPLADLHRACWAAKATSG